MKEGGGACAKAQCSAPRIVLWSHFSLSILAFILVTSLRSLGLWQVPHLLNCNCAKQLYLTDLPKGVRPAACRVVGSVLFVAHRRRKAWISVCMRDPDLFSESSVMILPAPAVQGEFKIQKLSCGQGPGSTLHFPGAIPSPFENTTQTLWVLFGCRFVFP